MNRRQNRLLHRTAKRILRVGPLQRKLIAEKVLAGPEQPLTVRVLQTRHDLLELQLVVFGILPRRVEAVHEVIVIAAALVRVLLARV